MKNFVVKWCFMIISFYCHQNPSFLFPRRALELNPNNLKAFFFAGQCHLALGQYDDAIAKLTTAHSLALETHKNFGDDIAASIRIAKRKRFEQLDEKRRQEEIEFQVSRRAEETPLSLNR